MNEEKIKEKELRVGKIFSLIQEYQESHPNLKFNFMIQKGKKDPKVFIHNLKTNIQEGDIFIEDENNESYGRGILSLNEEKFSHQLKSLLMEKKDEDFSFDLIFLSFKMFKDFTLELLKQTNELNIIQMDERVIDLFKKQSSQVLKNLKEVLIFHLEKKVKNLFLEVKKYEKQEHVFSFHLKGELEAYTRILNQLKKEY